MRTIIAAAFVLVSTSIVNAQGSPECYATFPGAQGKKCCDASFTKNAKGSLPNSERMAGLNACMAKSAPKKK